MKKWKIILPTLLVTSGLPLVSLVGCGDKPGPQPIIEPTFLQEGVGYMNDAKTAFVSIDWTPSSDSITFSNLSFSAKWVTVENVTCVEEGAHPCIFQIKFTSNIVSDITDGVFGFHYNDKTAHIEDDVSITNIKIDVFNPIIYCDQISTFTDGSLGTYDVVQSENISVVEDKPTTFKVDLNQYGDAIQDNEPIYFGVKRWSFGTWSLLGVGIDGIGDLYLGETRLTDISVSGDGDHTYWLEIKAPKGGWKSAIAASTDGYLVGDYTFGTGWTSGTILMFGQLQQTN